MSSDAPRRRATSIGPIEILLLCVGALVLALMVAGIVAEPKRREDAQRQIREAEERFIDLQVAEVEAGRTSTVVFYSTADTDAQVERLKLLPSLKEVVFQATDVSGTGIDRLRHQPNLTRLRFEGAPKLDDGAMEALTALPKLESLTLDYTRVSDKGIVELTGLAKLTSLTFSYDGRGAPLRCPMTDVALDNLSACAQLRELRFEGDWFSDAAVERLRQALPDCDITTHRFEPERGAAKPKN
ncbi:MAG: hypothetical protein HYX69_22995 [Planctomycetia bacterium]|nr:hypothetical protein [Planctomycetia bacterium]